MWCDIAISADMEFSSITDTKSKIESSYKITKGIFNIDINGDGTQDIVITGHRSNISAHGFNVHSFYIVTPVETPMMDPLPGGAESLNIIEIKEQEKDFKNSIFAIYTSPFDGENILSDLRLIKIKAVKGLFLLKTYRRISYSNSYVDPNDTFLDIYELKYDELECRTLFIKINTFKTKTQYNNALEALNELGIE